MNDHDRDELRMSLRQALGADPRDLALTSGETSACVDPNTLSALAEGGLEDGARRVALDHVDRCPRCLLALDAALGEARTAPTESPAPSGESRPARRLVARAVAVAAAAAVCFLLLRIQSDGDTAWLAERARLAPIELRLVRASDSDSERGEAVAAYSEGRYREAIHGITALPQPDAETGLVLGSALLLEGRTHAALAALTPLEEAPDASESVRREAAFHAAQALLLLGRLDPARARLERLATSPGVHRADAREQLGELDAGS